MKSLLHAAALNLPWHQALLAAGSAHAAYGEDVVVQWIEELSGEAASEQARRLGWALGEFGGQGAVSRLHERPLARMALQGARLGALMASPR